MKIDEFNNLKADLREYSRQFGVDAYLDMEEMEASTAKVGGTRIVLYITRKMPDGQPVRQWDKVPDYAPNTPDLLVCIKRDIKTAARELYSAAV